MAQGRYPVALDYYRQAQELLEKNEKEVEASFGGANTIFPSLLTDLRVDWDFNEVFVLPPPPATPTPQRDVARQSCRSRPGRRSSWRRAAPGRTLDP